MAPPSKRLRFYTTACFSLLAAFVLFPLIAPENRSSEEVVFRLCGATLLLVIAFWPLPEGPVYRNRR